jgi:hypothetical protein
MLEDAGSRRVRHNPAVVNRGRRTCAGLAVAATALIAALPAASAEAATGPPTLQLDLPKGVSLLDKVTATGQLPGAAAGEQVTVTVSASRRELFTKKVGVKADGGFQVPFVVNACCDYSVVAESGGQSSGAQRFRVGVPKHLRKGPIAHLFNETLRDMGFHTGPAGGKVTSGTHLAIKAFRKTNHMAWSEAYRPSIFRMLLQGQGRFEPRFTEGHHVEVDISRQVMALVEGDTATHVFHVSTGTGGTPTVQGGFHFYLKQPGYNAKQMYYSVYFIAGYATHGYASVPNHNASHGCVRNPIQFSRFIYNWIQLGDAMHVYS